ncbi:histidine phosphatase family protein [Rummeliibacillus sp. TYF005]|uniref:histidine phosphatase family protein n=1 Tax=Rummeliibacillus sp. TYF005 TaxID=2058214 RepID=UPI000F53604E|nr:histidine phosphatase family protein [Rummeliibacillus sp. TYF005]RPJ96607.1 histidine phosphatase family protein [Rummeliibacillus sp. TYF005]
MKRIYVVRHCRADGQEVEALLTKEGKEQAENLALFFKDKNIQRVISSPMTRAIQTIEPFTNKTNLNIQVDERLSERILSIENYPDWMEKLKQTFDNIDLKFKGGESSREASERIFNVINEVKDSDTENTIIVSHGNIITLLLKKLNQEVSFEDWKKVTNPDVFLLEYSEGEWCYKRVWNLDEIVK